MVNDRFAGQDWKWILDTVQYHIYFGILIFDPQNQNLTVHYSGETQTNHHMVLVQSKDNLEVLVDVGKLGRELLVLKLAALLVEHLGHG